MKVLFLITALTCLTLPAFAQRSYSSYTCKISYKHLDEAFYIDVGDKKEVEIGGWNLYANVEKKKGTVEASLSRIVNVLDATYKKDAKRAYPSDAKYLSVTLEHAFGGRVDVFTMRCFPRD